MASNNRLINFRAFLIIALFVTATVFCVYCYAYSCVAGIVLGVAVIMSAAALAVVYSVKCAHGKVRLAVPITFGLSVVLCVCAFSFGVTYCDNYNAGMVDGYCSVSGRVCVVDTQNGTYYADIDDIIINGKNHDGKLRIEFSASNNNLGELVRCGDTLQFGAYISSVELAYDGGINGTVYRNDLRYMAKVRSEDVVMKVGQPKPLESFSASLRRLLTDNMGEKYGNIAFSILTGDKHSLGTGTFGYFSAAGLGHIMAVSGLHIGFLVCVLAFLMCKLSKKVSYPIIAAILIAYAVLADFSPSIVRAVIMALVSGLGVLIGGRRDLLSSLLCAYSLLLAFRPLYLFEVGFLMSFGAIFGIAMFANSIRRGLEKKGAHKKFAGAMGGSLSASAGIIPAESYFFGTVHWLSFLVNLVVIPYVAVTFMVLLVSLAVAAIPYCGPILIVSKYLLVALDYVARGVSAIPYLSITVQSYCFVFLWFPIMFTASEYVMMPTKTKTAVRWYSAAVCIALLALCAL